ncbi:hypothetical protein HBI53_210160 [Parastagonospora nodorum]|nr:hypothetical protein HBI53_210160 [Parastagonospora nodorum]
MASLSALPTELLSQITRHLVTPKYGFEDNGICSLRLTCRALCLKTQYEFGKAAFSTLRLDLHAKLLQLLLNISKRPAFGEGVKQLVFAQLGDERIAFPSVEDDELDTLKEQVLFMLSQVFTEALPGLPNLQEVVIITPFAARFRRYDVIQGSSFMDTSVWKEDYDVTVNVLHMLIAQAVGGAGIRTMRTRRFRHYTAASLVPMGSHRAPR